MLTPPGRLGIVEVDNTGQVGAEVVLDLAQVLRSRRDNLGLGDQAVVADAVAVVEQAARGLGRVAALAGGGM